MPLSPQTKTRLKRFYETLQDRPLAPGDPFYCNFIERSGSDPIAQLATRIDLNHSHSINLLSGQRGTGKSTELKRLGLLLEGSEHVVLYCDMNDYLNMSTAPEVSDFLISLMAALAQGAERYLDADPLDSGCAQELWQFLNSEVKLSELSLEAGIGGFKTKLALALRNDPDFKKLLQQRSRGHITHLVKLAHQFCADLVAQIQQKTGKNKVVALFDSIEHIQGVGAEAQDVYRSVSNLFSVHAEKLMWPKLHAVYTIPPYLIPLVPNLTRCLGGAPIVSLPSVHVRQRQSVDADSSGLAIMREIVQLRDRDWREIFHEGQIDTLAIASGGDLRDFFRLLQDALVRAFELAQEQFPLPDALITAVQEQLRRELLPIAKSDAVWLRRIHHSKRCELPDMDNLHQLARFFDTNLAINYRNGDDWYDVHPLIVDEIELLAGDAVV